MNPLNTTELPCHMPQMDNNSSELKASNMPEKSNEEFWAYLDRLIERSKIIIEHTRGSQNEDLKDLVYPLDYGYLAGTTSSDGAGIDVWLGASGEKRAVGILCTVDLLKRDSEIKILLGCTEEEMHRVVDFLNRGDLRCFHVHRHE